MAVLKCRILLSIVCLLPAVAAAPELRAEAIRPEARAVVHRDKTALVREDQVRTVAAVQPTQLAAWAQEVPEKTTEFTVARAEQTDSRHRQAREATVVQPRLAIVPTVLPVAVAAEDTMAAVEAVPETRVMPLEEAAAVRSPIPRSRMSP